MRASSAKRRRALSGLPGPALAVALAAAMCAVAGWGAPASAAAQASGKGELGAAATLTGPITVGQEIEPITAHPLVLTTYGYIQQEFFASGTARAFRAVTSPPGRQVDDRADDVGHLPHEDPRPAAVDPAKFSGTVVVEWMNESAGESAPDWDYLNPELMDAGDAWVGVSAQALGIEGGKPILGSISGSGKGLIQQEPGRYGSLHHPGDQYALDIFDQVGLGLRSRSWCSAACGPALRGGGRVAVGLLSHDLRRHLAAAQPRLRRHLHPQPGRERRTPGRCFDHLRQRCRGRPMDKDRPRHSGVHVRDADRLIELGYAAAQQPDTRRHPDLGGCGHFTCRQLLVGSAASVLGCTSPINDGPSTWSSRRRSPISCSG